MKDDPNAEFHRLMEQFEQSGAGTGTLHMGRIIMWVGIIVFALTMCNPL